jgi:UPF0755 protein
MKFVKVVLIIFTILAGTFITAALVGYFYYTSQINKLIAVSKDEKELDITIERGMGVNEISDYFTKEGIISNPLILKAYLFLNKDKKIEAGYYRIPKEDLNLQKMVALLQNGTFEQKLTFIEGWRTEEYVDYLRKQMGDEFADAFAKSSYLKEGYMFPDTYIIEEDYPADSLASWMRNTFDKRVTADLVAKAQTKNLTLDQAIIVASILEREMNIKKDRPKVAGILIKRWQNGWPLQADATVQYAKGNKTDWWPVVTRDDLRSIESPYNTYLNKTLPPAPISNPSFDAIQAVINYEETPYWFYVTGKDGVTHYSETLEQHNANVAKYL